MTTSPAVGTVQFLSHVGVCVSDYDKSFRFYTEGLGFQPAEGFEIRDALAPLAEVEPPVRCRSQMLVNGPAKIELLGWKTPSAEGFASTSRRQIGLTHLCVYVDDLRAVERRLVELGGSALEHTRLHVPMPEGAMDVLFLADPDGIRIELVEVTTG